MSSAHSPKGNLVIWIVFGDTALGHMRWSSPGSRSVASYVVCCPHVLFVSVTRYYLFPRSGSCVGKIRQAIVAQHICTSVSVGLVSVCSLPLCLSRIGQFPSLLPGSSVLETFWRRW